MFAAFKGKCDRCGREVPSKGDVFVHDVYGLCWVIGVHLNWVGIIVRLQFDKLEDTSLDFVWKDTRQNFYKVAQ